MKNLISVSDFTKSEIESLFRAAAVLKKKPFSKSAALKSKSIALVFQKPSNRTRVSFEVAVASLGGHVIYLGPEEIKLGVRESVKDAAKVFSRYLDGIVARTFKHEDIIEMAKFSSIPVINGLSDLLHPCQGLSDIFTIEEKFGKRKIKISYVGDGNNVLHSLLLAAAILGKNLYFSTPKGYAPNEEILLEAKNYAKKNKSKIESVTDPKECVKDTDVLYTDVWVSMGEESEAQAKLSAFSGFQVNKELVSFAKKNALIMHCLPAHRGEEITSEVLDSKNSIVYEQAENRLHIEKAILLKLLKK